MKTIQLSLIAGAVLLIAGGVAQAADLEDLDITVRVVEDNDSREMRHELTLPAAAREHMDDRERHREHDAQENESRDGEGDYREGQEDDREAQDENRDSYDQAHEERHESEEQDREREEVQDTHEENTDPTL